MQATLSAHPVVADAADARQLARTRVIALARLMDSAVELPGLRTRVGLDAVLGLAPVVGDVISAAIGLYIVHQARELGASRWLQARMVANLLTDAALGAVPLAGDLADVYFRANVRNLKLMQKVLGEPYIDVEPLR
jgi:ubiquinone biosynthesis protein UbiJ